MTCKLGRFYCVASFEQYCTSLDGLSQHDFTISPLTMTKGSQELIRILMICHPQLFAYWLFVVCCLFSIFSKKSFFRNTARVTNSLDLDLGPNCLLKLLSADDNSRLIVKVAIETSFKSFFRNTVRVTNSLDIDQARRIVGPDLGPNCLQK